MKFQEMVLMTTTMVYDDIHGINTLVRDSEGKATMNIMDTHSHGTHVSGSIADSK